MGDMGEIFKAMKVVNQEHREEEYPKRIAFAIKQFEANNISFTLCNEINGHFNLYVNQKVVMSFWSWTGKIHSRHISIHQRGIKNCIKHYKKLKHILGQPK